MLSTSSTVKNPLSYPTDMDKVLLMWSRVIFAIACFGGLVTHVTVITMQYLEYDASNIIKLDIPKKMSPPALSICWRYADLLNVNKLNNDHGLNIQPVNFSDRARTLTEIQRGITLRQIFDYTPSVNEVYSSVKIRKPESFVITNEGEQVARRSFTIKKFYVQQHMCYRVEMNFTGKYDYVEVSSAMAYPRVTYQFGFNYEKFKNVQILVPIIHRAGTWPRNDILFAPEMKRFDVGDSTVINQMVLTYRYIYNEKLEEPYPTSCRHYNVDDKHGSQSKCKAQCLINGTSHHMGRLPFEHIITEDDLRERWFDVDKKLLHNLDLIDESTSNQLRHIASDCNASCWKDDCKSLFAITEYVRSGYDTNRISFRVMLPAVPNIIVKYHARMEFFEFATYVMSCLGTWLGLSILDLNPVKCIAENKNMIKNALSSLAGQRNYSHVSNAGVSRVIRTREMVKVATSQISPRKRSVPFMRYDQQPSRSFLHNTNL